MSFAKRVFRRLPMAVKSPAVATMKLAQRYTSAGRFYARAAALNVVEMSVRGEYGVITHSAADRTMLPTYARTGRWNHEMNQRLVTFFAKGGGTYVDVGANVGLTIIPTAQNPDVDVIGFEPDPVNFRYLSRNVAANCTHGNVTLHRLAAFREATELTFELSPDNLGNHSIRPGARGGIRNELARDTITVEARRLDDIVAVKRGPVAVKIDTEGAESFVIEGGPNLLSEARLLFTEVWPYGIVRTGGNLGGIAKLLKDQFRTFSIPSDFGPETIPSNCAEEFLLPLASHSNDPWFHFDLSAVK